MSNHQQQSKDAGAAALSRQIEDRKPEVSQPSAALSRQREQVDVEQAKLEYFAARGAYISSELGPELLPALAIEMHAKFNALILAVQQSATLSSQIELEKHLDRSPGSTDDAAPEVVLSAICHCASLWENGVRLLGNIRATDIQRATAAGAAAIRRQQSAALSQPSRQLVEALDCIGNIINDAPYRGEERDGAWQAFLENRKVIESAALVPDSRAKRKRRTHRITGGEGRR